jgi:hypothetical protein
MNQHLTQRTTLSILIAAACLTAFGLTPAQTAHAQGTVVTTPLQRYGLGSLECAAYSPDVRYIVSGGGGGAVLFASPSVICRRISNSFARRKGGKKQAEACTLTLLEYRLQPASVSFRL